MAVVEVEVDSTDDEARLPHAARRFHPSPVELFAAAVALLIPVASPAGLVATEAVSGRAVILLLAMVVGLPVLLSQARRRDALAARAAVAFLVVGLASAALSPNHTTAVFGLYDQGTGLLFMASLGALWAIGRSQRPVAGPLIERALLVGVLINVGIALVASAFDLPSMGVTLIQQGRALALAGNSVQLGALTALGLALLVPRFVAEPARWALPVVATAAAAQLSGTRVALAAIAVIVAWAVRRHGVRMAAGLAIVVVLGLAAGSALAPSPGTSATSRVSGLGESWRVRPETWLTARHSLAKHPVLGIGPGQFRTATSPYRPISVARMEGADKLFTDAHNIFVEYATTTGFLGLGALLLWLLAAMRHARGCLLAGAVAIIIVQLFEPQSLATTPLAFLALGASWPRDRVLGPTDLRSTLRIIWTCSAVAAIAVAALFLAGEFNLRQAQLDTRLAPALQANRLLPRWPKTAAIVANVWLYEAIVGKNQVDLRQSRAWQRTALSRDGSDPSLWNDLAELDEATGRPADATTEYLSALRLNPGSARAMNGLGRLARDRCDLEQEQYWKARSLQVSLPATNVLPRPTPACAAARRT